MAVYEKYVRRVLLLISLVATMGIVLLYIMGYDQYVSGWMWGCGTNLLYFLVLAKQVKSWTTVPLEQLKAKVKVSVLSRFTLIVSSVVIATQISNISIPAVLAGLLIFKPLHYVDFFILRRRTPHGE